MSATKRRRRAYVTKRAIAEYWELGDTECKANGDPAMHCDVGEPRCWACGLVGDARHDGRPDSYDYAYWLQKAHLMSHAADGPDIPSNFVLLCNRCHVEMDRSLGRGTNRSRQAAIDWVLGWHTRWTERVRAASAEVGLTPKRVCEAFDKWGSDVVCEVAKAHGVGARDTEACVRAYLAAIEELEAAEQRGSLIPGAHLCLWLYEPAMDGGAR